MSSRIPLLLLPGLLCDAALWQNQIKHLKDIADCTIGNTTQSDTIAAIASDVLKNAPAVFALAGLSMGGYVALEIMRQAPRRVLKLAIFDSSARAESPMQRQRRQRLLEMSNTGHFKGVTPRLLPTLIHPSRVSDQTLTELIMDMAERVGRDAFQNQLTAIINRIDSRPFLKDITCPTLIGGGRQDIVSPLEVVQEMASAIKGAVCEIIENCGHLSTLEQPERVNRLMADWLCA